jgi:hypothetical protein
MILCDIHSSTNATCESESVAEMITFIIHSSPLCIDSCILYDIVDYVVHDLKYKLKLPVNFIFLFTDNLSCDVSVIYCQQHGITYNTIDPRQANLKEATSELNLTDTILLAIFHIVNINSDDTMKLVDAMLKCRNRVIMLSNNYREYEKAHNVL